MRKLQWFKNRIGKKIYREDVECMCATCKNVTKTGLVIHDDMHAEYLFMIQHELNIKYFDKKSKL